MEKQKTMIGIYKITNPVGLDYIGQSGDIKKRFRAYKTNGNPLKHGYIYQSIFDYGFNNHIFEIVEECEKEQLNERERYWQEFYFVLECGLNSVLIGTKDKKAVYCEKTLKKMSLEMKGKKVGDKNPMFGKIRPEVGVRNVELKGKKIINTLTNEVYISAVEASKITGISLSTIKRSLHKNYSEKYNLKYA